MRPAGSVDRPSAVAGVVLVALGAVLALDQAGAFELRFGVLAPIACAAVGAILVVTGLTRRD